MRRRLTEEEIDFILDFITPNPRLPLEAAVDIARRQREPLSTQLREVEIVEAAIPELKSILKNRYFSSLIQAGSSCGIWCGQSIGERLTQATLDSFHTAGQTQRLVVNGVPRMKQLMSVSKNPKSISCKIYTKEVYASFKDTRDALGSDIVEIHLRDLIVSHSEVADVPNIEVWRQFLEIIDPDIKIFEVHLSLDLLYRNRVKPSELMNAMIDRLGIHSFLGRDTAGNLVLVFGCKDIRKVLDQHLLGFAGIMEVYFVRDDRNRWYIESMGSNFKKLLAHPLIDSYLTTSSNVWDIVDVFGIEAARAFLIREFVLNMESINPCHPKLVADRMTFGGSLNALARSTLKEDTSGVLSKVTFEECVACSLEAAVACESDPMQSLSANVIFGQRAKLGSGYFGLQTDIEMLRDNKT